jgi:glutamate/tyrosine decarboxylase-like PLP-dependent enzyme
MADLADRRSPLDMTPDEFRRVGHEMVDRLADFWDGVRDQPVTHGDDPVRAWGLVGKRALPEQGEPAGDVLSSAFDMLANGSLLNGHPKFFGYITAGAAPIGVLADLLASGINPNCGGWPLSPVASTIEIQTVQWIAELIGYPSDCGGALCSGGNVANMLAFWAARGAEPREEGVGNHRLRAYASAATHTWLQKAADLSGIGASNVVNIPIDGDERMSVSALRAAISADVAKGFKPFIVVASGGTVSTGAIDDLAAVRKVCDEFDLWMHVDGAYGAFAACLPENPEGIQGLALADSVALDPHKWLYAPLEAGCVLVRDRAKLFDAFSYRPAYYHFGREDSPDWCNFYEVTIQNSRGFRALKVWAALRQAGRAGYVESIRQDVALTRAMYDYAAAQPEIEVRSCRLSIVTFRYRPERANPNQPEPDLNSLNQRILAELQEGGEAFVSNAVIDGDYLLRACIVNFRTRLSDVQETVDLVVRLGRKLSSE